MMLWGILGVSVVLVVLKMAGVVPINQWSWWWVTSPVWVTFLLNFAGNLVIDFLKWRDRRFDEKYSDPRPKTRK